MPIASWRVVKPPRTQHVLRRHPRHLLSVPIRVFARGASDRACAHGLTLDLSQGGVSAVLCGSLRCGDIVQLELRLPNQTINTQAIVRHASESRCGFEFLEPSEDFDRYVAECILGLEQ